MPTMKKRTVERLLTDPSAPMKMRVEMLRQVCHAEEEGVRVEEALQLSNEVPEKETYGPVPVPGGVLFKIEAQGASKVSVIGDFNSWDEPLELNDDDEDGIEIEDAAPG